MTSTVCIAKNVYGGDGIGRLGDGRVVFVPGAWAGEQVKAEIIEEKRHWVKARLVSIEEPSPQRIDGSSRHVPGMVYANLSVAGEETAKELQLKEFFERARIALPEIEKISAPNAFNYRNKAVYHFAKEKGRLLLGYREEPSHAIFNVTEDPLVRAEINAKLGEVRQSVFALMSSGSDSVRKSVEQQGNVTVRWSAKSGVHWWIGKPQHEVVMKESACGKTFDVPADGFWQVNPEVGDLLAKSVAAEYAKGAENVPDVLDLYCGVGVLGILCNPPKLIGVESGRQAVEFAKRNAAAHGIGAARFFAEEVGRNVRRLPLTAKTTLVVDPPRGGMEQNVPKAIVASRIQRMIYVSCDPATLIRDVRVLSSAFNVKSVRWFNMFPRTARFETMVVLERRNG